MIEPILSELIEALRRPLEILSFADNMYAEEQFFKESIQSGFQGWYDPALINPQLDFILERCDLQPPARVLDLATGHAQHALALAERGFEVLGTDISLVLIDHLNQKFANERLQFAQLSFNQVSAWQEFDLVLILGNSLSLVPPEDALDALKKVKDSLLPGGCLFLQLDNRPYYIAREAGRRDWRETPGNELLLSEHIYDPALHLEKTLDTSLDLNSGKICQYPLTKYLYIQQELYQFLEKAGLLPEEMFGDWDASPVTEHSPSLLSISRQSTEGERPATRDRRPETEDR